MKKEEKNRVVSFGNGLDFLKIMTRQVAFRS